MSVQPGLRRVVPSLAAVCVICACCLFAGTAIGVAQEAAPLPRDWSPELAPAWAAYLSGDYVAAQRYCERVRSELDSERGEQDVKLLIALCLLHMDARESRLEGSARLSQLRQDDPSLALDPECLLAGGIAQLGLHETADALEKLDRAVASFAGQRLPGRELAALTALAEAWAAHTEWEATPARFDVDLTGSGQSYRDVRRSRIGAIRARVEALPGHAEALARVDLTVGRLLLESGDTAEEGRQLLRGLVAAERLNEPRAEAAWSLAVDAAEREEWAAAIELYESLGRRWDGELAERAMRAAANLREPGIELELPEVAVPGAAVEPRLRVRGIDQIELNVRALELEEWLAKPAVRGQDARLPESGSVRAAFDLRTAADVPYGWWSSVEAESPLTLSLAVGAYVVVVRGTDHAAREHVVKRLLVVSNLVGTCVVGSERMVIWVREAAPDRPEELRIPAGACRARFWMQYSFAPREVVLDNGVGSFELPPEARLTRDSRWYCLLQTGGDAVLCRGSLPGPEGTAAARRLALVGGPPMVSPGETLHVSGLLLSADVGSPVAAGELVDVQVVDAIEHEVFSGSVAVGPGGAFSVDVPIPVDVGDQHLRIRCRHADRVLPNVFGPLTCDTAPAARPLFRVDVEVPPWTGESHARVVGQVRATYPWGSVPPRMRIACDLVAVPLPESGPQLPVRRLEPITRNGRLDEVGVFPLWVPVNNFGPIEGPSVVVLTAAVRSWEGRRGVARKAVLAGPEPAHAWITYFPESPTVEGAVRFNVGWFEPEARTVVEAPDVTVERDGVVVARLDLRPSDGGLISQPWHAPTPGVYTARTEIPALDADPLVAETSFEVVVDAATNRGTLRAARATVAAERPAVELELDGVLGCPGLVLVEDGQPLAAASVGGSGGLTPLTLRLPRALEGPAWAALYSLTPAGLELLAAVPVETPNRADFSLELDVPEVELWPGASVPIGVRVEPAGVGPVAVVARLIPASDVGFTVPLAADTAPEQESPRLHVSTTVGAAEVSPPSAAGRLEGVASSLPAELEWGLREGSTAWCTATTLDGAGELPVVLPAVSGLYKLIVVAYMPEGRCARGACLLDARRGLRSEIDLPACLTVGDRTLLALRLENGRPEPVGVDVRLSGDDGLRLDAVRVIRPGVGVETRPLDAALAIELEPAAGVWIHAEVEAVGVGVHAVGAVVSNAEATRELRAPCQVLPLPVQPPAGAVHIDRKVSVWASSERSVDRGITRKRRGPVLSRSELRDELGDWDDEEFDGEDPAWFWSPVEEDARLEVGCFLLVEETFALEEPTGAFTWTQHLPATCCTVSATPDGYDPIGRRIGSEETVLRYEVSGLGPGVHRHQYFMAVVRPGAGLLSAPELRGGGVDQRLLMDVVSRRYVVVPAD